MESYEYICLPITIILDGEITQYNLRAIGGNVHVYDDIRKVMYGLPQVEQIANYFITKNITPHVHYQCCNTPGLCRHKWIPVSFCLVVDDFVVKYVANKHAEHVIICIQKYYPVSVDWAG